VDVQAAVAQGAGVGRYTRMLVEQLARLADQDELWLFYFDFRRRGLGFDAPGARCRALRWVPGRIVQQLWKRCGWPPFEWLAGRADLYHFPNFIVPPLTGGRAVVTIHDVSFLRHPEFTEERNLVYLRACLSDTVRRAAAIITDSEFCVAEIAALLPEAGGKLHCVHPGIGSEFTPPSSAALADWRSRRGLDGPYLLTVGTLEPRKNFAMLLDVFENLPEFEGELVLAGRRGWKYAPLLDRIRRSPLAGRVRVLEDVADGELPLLYAGAELFVFPSFYEGFGFPPLEAMACGTPVISSAGGSLPEVLGEGALVLHDWSAAAWTAAVRDWLRDDSLRRQWAERGRQWAARYNWEAAARATLRVYHGTQA
ncbi:MAG: glycosyltransferase family 4 protein, partial [Lentisphaerae bacterium]|nr:glycosyltransferase family 4 protein [Lentisphaerota bacterium]